MKESLRYFLRLVRPLSNIKNIAIISLAFYFSKTPFNLALFILGTISLSFVFSSIYAYNTLCDARLDKENSNKFFYSEAVQYFGESKISGIVIAFLSIGLFLGLFINTYFFVALLALLLVGFLYSCPYTRFKEKIGLDILFGASLTFLLRFVASWFIFSISFPPVLPIMGLVCLKNGGYILYKGYDRPFLQKLHVKNSITSLSRKAIFFVSAIFFALSIFCFMLICLNANYIKMYYLGYLPITFLPWLLFFIPPIVMQYLLFFNIIYINPRYTRAIGFMLLFILIIMFLKMGPTI